MSREDISPFSLTMGQLVRELELFADLYESLPAGTDRDTVASSSYRRLSMMEGMENIRQYSLEAHDSEPTIRTINLMIDELVDEYGIDRSKAEGLWLQQAWLELSTIPATRSS